LGKHRIALNLKRFARSGVKIDPKMGRDLHIVLGSFLVKLFLNRVRAEIKIEASGAAFSDKFFLPVAVSRIEMVGLNNRRLTLGAGLLDCNKVALIRAKKIAKKSSDKLVSRGFGRSEFGPGCSLLCCLARAESVSFFA
jgi:hypothetical protein